MRASADIEFKGSAGVAYSIELVSRGRLHAEGGSVRRLRLALLAPFLTICACGTGTGQTEQIDPRTLPSRFMEVGVLFNASMTAVDFDGDGLDELVSRYSRPSDFNPDHSVLLLQTHAGQVYEQLNYDGPVQPPIYRDVNGDGLPEILAPVIRNDTLFLSAATGQAKKLFGFALTSGEPRSEPEGNLPWDPWLVDVYLVDTNEDGEDELVSVVTTGFARLPRGVFVHSMPGGKLLGSTIVGAFITESVLSDFDEDGKLELLLAAAATNNGARAGGFDDSKSYLILFELTPTPPTIAWSREIEGMSGIRLLHEDFDGDGVGEVFLASQGQGGVRTELIETDSWRTSRERFLPEQLVTASNLGSPAVVDLDRDARPEVVFAQRAGDVLVLDTNLDLVRRRRVAQALGGMRILPDLDRDGTREIWVWDSNGCVILLDPDLGSKAVLPSGRFSDVQLRGIGNRPYVLVAKEDHTVILELANNPLYWAYRYGPAAAKALGVSGVAVVALMLAALRRRYRLSQAIQTLQLDSEPRGLLLLDSRGKVRWSNNTLRNWLNADREAAGVPEEVGSLSALSPEIVEFTRRTLRTRPPRQGSLTISVNVGDGPGRMRVLVEPLVIKVRGDPHWFVSIAEARRASDSDPTTTWPLMAQRVAHGLKNPLTSILLTLQRLQMEYRETAPAVANRLDRYSGRIEARIEELRRLTNNFLKLVNVEEPELVEVDVNDMVRKFADSCRRSLPPDIQMNLKLGTSLPSVRLDTEQMHDVLDNLVANAMNSMPDGGVISVSTSFTQGVRLVEGEPASDYVELEIMDTGTGIAHEIRDRLFEPGFSRANDGSGLGLAIVKKIVTDHHGEVHVESEVGSGTAISVLLPVSDGVPEDSTRR